MQESCCGAPSQTRIGPNGAFRFQVLFPLPFSEAVISLNFAAGQSLAVPSEPQVAMRFPSGEKATELSTPPSGVSINATWWSARDQNRMLPSQLVETSVLSSGAKANPNTISV